MLLLSGTTLAQTIQSELKKKIEGFKQKPTLAVILVGSVAASHTYVGVKKKACEEVGIHSEVHTFDETVSFETLLKKIHELNANPKINGILVQSPLPAHIPFDKIIEAIDPNKDVDGFHPINMGKLILGIPGFIPCTPLGIKVLLERYQINTKGANVVIVGRSNIVGKPMSALLMQKEADATVTVAHSKTIDLPSVTKKADILIAAIGLPLFIKAEMVKEGAVVIDVGINRIEDPQNARGYRLVGDVDFDKVAPKCKAITPVPKGVGPMTVAMLLHNTVQSFEKSHP